MDVSLALVLPLRVPVRVVRVAHRSVIVLVRMTRTEVLEATSHPVVVVSHVKVVVGVGQSLVLMIFPASAQTVVRHIHSRSLLPAGDRQPLSYPICRIV